MSRPDHIVGVGMVAVVCALVALIVTGQVAL